MRKTLFALALLLTTTGCADLLVENQNDPDRERALASPADVQSLLQGATVATIFELNDNNAVNTGAWADQTTATNNVRGFRAFADEPRRRWNNRTTNPDLFLSSIPWGDFNTTQSSANTILTLIEVDGNTIEIDGVDETLKTQAGAYFARGVARGYLGLMYNQANIVDVDTDLTALEPAPYTDLIAAAVADLEEAKTIANQATGFTWDFLPGSNVYSLAAFEEIANSFAARFLMGQARTQAEAAALPASHWNSAITYAQNGVGTAIPAFSPAAISGQFFHEYADWNTFLLSGPAGYLPVDVKQIHLLDPDYPVAYPAEGILPPAESNDPRLAYYAYTTQFGFLNASRNRSLFSNYFHLRMFADNDWFGGTGYPIPLITSSEMQYVIAEANLWLGNKAAAAAALENSPFGSVATTLEYPLPSVTLGYFEDFDSNAGYAAGKTIDASASDAQFVRALHTEYAVELDLMGGAGLQWYFMRRHDLLQPGTPLHYPIPGDELEVTLSEYYTFGGAGFEGEEGTADGSNNWKTFDTRFAGQLDLDDGDNVPAGARLYVERRPSVNLSDLITGSKPNN